MSLSSRRLLLTSSLRRKRLSNAYQHTGGDNGINSQQDAGMAKKRSSVSNGSNAGNHTSTRTVKHKTSNNSPSKSKTNISGKSNWTKLWVFILSAIVLVLSVILLEYGHTIGAIFKHRNSTITKDSTSKTKPVSDGGWRLADDLTNSLYDSSICTIDRLYADEITQSLFEETYRFKKPLIVKFRNGANGWTDRTKWTVESLSQEYGDWSVYSGNAREIVRRGGSGYIDTSFSSYVKEMIRSNDSIGEPLYVFDREFYKDSSLPKTLHLPSYLTVKTALDDSIFFLGSSGSGVSFHKHADGWNGVVYGRKRWFLYPVHHTPPGGVYPGYTQIEWYKKIYPELSEKDKPMECIQEPGEILYLPEGTYHGTINLGDTIAIGLQKKDAQTEWEKLFYEEHKIVKQLQTETNGKKKNKLLQRKKEIYVSMLEMLPDNSEVQMRAGQLYKEIGALDIALTYTAKAIELDPHFIVAVISQGELYAQLGNLVEAEKFFKQAITMNPKLWDCYARYGDFLFNNNRPAEAVDIFRQGTILHPDMVVFWSRLKLAQERSGDVAGAQETQKTMSKLQKR